MKITILPLGSRGDVQPYIALGVGLKNAGHQVTIATSRDFEAFIRQYGLGFAPLSGDIQAMLKGEFGSKVMAQGTNFIGFIRESSKMVEQIAQDVSGDCITACEGADLIITTSTTLLFGQLASDILKIPYMLSYLIPFIPTRDIPSIFAPEVPAWMPFQRYYNKFSSTAILQTLWLLMRAPVNKTRARFDLPPTSFTRGLRELKKGEISLIFGFSPLIVPPSLDFGKNIRVTGYWFLDQVKHYQPPDRLVEFLKAGTPPVYVGFGSMPDKDPAGLAKLIIDALTQTGQRGILLTGWSGMSNLSVPDNILVIDSAAHDWLFPQMAAVVHHGGSGTTSAVLRAGVPGIVIPYIADQPFWGKRVYELGVGAKPIPRKTLTAEKLAAAIRTVTGSEPIKHNAKQLGEKIRAEDGVGEAVRFIEQFEAMRAVHV